MGSHITFMQAMDYRKLYISDKFQVWGVALKDRFDLSICAALAVLYHTGCL